MHRSIPAAILLVFLAFGAPGARAVEVLKLRHAATLYADALGTPLRVPQGVGCGGKSILVADSGNARVLRVEVSGALLLVTGAIAIPEIAYPVRADADASGNLVILDGKTRRLGRVRPDGAFGGWVDVPRADGAPAPAIRSFALAASGAIWAVDSAGARVVAIASSGSLERSIGLPAEAKGIDDVAVDARGTVFALDGVGRRVWVARAGDAAFGPFSASLTEDLDYPTALDADASGRILVADGHGGGVVILGPDGSFRGRQSGFGWKDGFLRYPTDLCSDGHGRVVVADRENQRVQVFTVGE